MKFLIQTVLTIVFCFILQFFFPWWTLAIGALAAGFVGKNNNPVSFIAGFLGAGLLWLCISVIGDISTGSILSEKVGRILPLSPFILTTLIGAVVGGFAGMTGSSLAPLLKR